jgi:hypothetical protein
VLRLLPTKRGMPSVMTALTAVMSPFLMASSAAVLQPHPFELPILRKIGGRAP